VQALAQLELRGWIVDEHQASPGADCITTEGYVTVTGMAEQIEVSELIPASPERVYRAWLDGTEHAAMTGGNAFAEEGVGGRFSAWDEYITGENVELIIGRRIVQSWRSKDFPVDAPDSRLEIQLEESDGGTRITVRHSEIPDGQSADYEQGWRDHYFTPMRRYFSTHAQRNGESKTGFEPDAEQPETEPHIPTLTSAPPPEVDAGWEPAEEPRREDDLPAAPPKKKAAAKPKKPAVKAKAKPVAAKAKAKPVKAKAAKAKAKATPVKAKAKAAKAKAKAKPVKAKAKAKPVKAKAKAKPAKKVAKKKSAPKAPAKKAAKPKKKGRR
jgi:uncharacterized protein YndB with AHSA1/START domain